MEVQKPTNTKMSFNRKNNAKYIFVISDVKRYYTVKVIWNRSLNLSMLPLLEPLLEGWKVLKAHSINYMEHLK